MASEIDWKEASLGEIVELKRGYDLPKNKRVSGIVPIVSSSGVSDFHAEAMVKGPGVITGRYGTIGEVYYVSEDYWPLNTTLYVRDFKGNHPRFISYLLKTLDFQAYSDKGAVPGLNRNHLHLARVRIPRLATQKCIAGILSSIDLKIDMNRRINQTLEAMAQAIFKSWFIDFDPVKAKISAIAEGRDPLRAAMSAISGKFEIDLDALLPEQYAQLAETAARFPDEMEVPELGRIPKGWSHKMLAQLTDKIGSGSTPRGGKEVYLDEGVALIRSQNVYDSLFVWEGLARISDDAATQLKGVTVQEDDVLLNITGASILRTCVVEPDALPARVNQHVAIIRAKAGVPPRFIHMHLLRPDIKSYLLGLNAGASREAITKGHIEALTLLTPDPELLAAFQTATAPLFQQVQRFAHQMRVLGELRDALLPKLLSGELSVEALTEPTATT